MLGTFEILLILVVVAVPLVWMAIWLAVPVPPEEACRSCGFLLIGASGPRCPECGSTVGRWGAEGRTARRRLTLQLVALAFGLFAVHTAMLLLEPLTPFHQTVQYRGKIAPQQIEFVGRTAGWTRPARNLAFDPTTPEPDVVEFRRSERRVHIERAPTASAWRFPPDEAPATAEALLDRLDPDGDWSGDERDHLLSAIGTLMAASWGDGGVDGAREAAEADRALAVADITQVDGSDDSTAPLRLTMRLLLLAAGIVLGTRMILAGRRTVTGVSRAS